VVGYGFGVNVVVTGGPVVPPVMVVCPPKVKTVDGSIQVAVPHITVVPV
jgi:hypothetical protein